MTRESELLTLAGRVVDQAAAGEQIEVVVSDGTSTSIRVYEAEVESFTTATSGGVGIRVIDEGRVGYATAGTLDPTVIAETLEQARTNARFAERDEHAGLAEPDGLPVTEIDQFSTDLAGVTADDKIGLALEVERRVLAADKRITGIRTAMYGDRTAAFALASTTGIAVAERATGASVGVHALALDGERTMSGGGGHGALDPSGLDLDYVVERAVRQATGLIGATKPASGPVKLVLDPNVASSLFGVIAGMLTGSRVVKGRTPFADRVGEAIASERLSLSDEPLDTGSLAATGTDGEGLACRSVPLITDGVLDGFLFDTYNARRLGTVSTASAQRGARSLPGPGPHVLSVAAGTDGTHEELIAGVEHGILVFSLAGFHSGINPVSGDLSLGVDGLMIRNGQLAEPISEATVGSTLQRMLLGIEAIGSDRTHLSNGAVSPSVIVGDVMLSGSSD